MCPEDIISLVLCYRAVAPSTEQKVAEASFLRLLAGLVPHKKDTRLGRSRVALKQGAKCPELCFQCGYGLCWVLLVFGYGFLKQSIFFLIGNP